eukprot:SAG22_NODE_271_length_13227_cov_34.282983_7_plen_92_part_00
MWVSSARISASVQRRAPALKQTWSACVNVLGVSESGPWQPPRPSSDSPQTRFESCDSPTDSSASQPEPNCVCSWAQVELLCTGAQDLCSSE